MVKCQEGKQSTVRKGSGSGDGGLQFAKRTVEVGCTEKGTFQESPRECGHGLHGHAVLESSRQMAV